MKSMSVYAALAHREFGKKRKQYLHTFSAGKNKFLVYIAANSLWVQVIKPRGSIAFRTAFYQGAYTNIVKTEQADGGIIIQIDCLLYRIFSYINFPSEEEGILKYRTELLPHADLILPQHPRDILFPLKSGEPGNAAGEIYFKQAGTRSGIIYFKTKRPEAGSVLYFQNLGALSAYCEQTKTSCKETVGGEWPELGFALPVSDQPVKKGKRITISDAYVFITSSSHTEETKIIKEFLRMTGELYVAIPKPETSPRDWQGMTEKGLRDLLNSPGCWSQNAGEKYFNAYVCDYKTPPEIMVQLAVLLPLTDYMEWKGEEMPVKEIILKGLTAFYDPRLKTIVRWLPSAQDQLDGKEEQKKPHVMDSWYLHHPLLNLSRMAMKGNALCRQLFLDSIEYAIRVARHFKYEWPVFYDMYSLDIIKKETEPGKGGEQDVAGLYAHIMIQAYELTGKKRFLHEAERAAVKLSGKGFNLFYQANNTSFSAGALLRMYKITGKKKYLDLSYLCIANILKNVQLYEAGYGHCKNFPTFFAVFPLSNAPYTAVYEEQEVFCAMHDYLKHAEGVDLLPSVHLLFAEYIRHLINRAAYYYPPMLPADMLADKPKTGELDRKLWIALEDLHDGWEQSGQVGQEVYGAGNAFGIIARHCYKINEGNFYVFVDYPTTQLRRKGRSIYLSILGDERMSCKLSLISADGKRIPATEVYAGKARIKQYINALGNREYVLPGKSRVRIHW